MVIKIYSHRDVFNDGNEKLHPAFKLGGTLFVLTNTRPQHTPSIIVEACKIKSRHFGQDRNSFLTVAYNQSAPKYNEISGGTITLSTKDIQLISATFRVELIDRRTLTKE